MQNNFWVAWDLKIKSQGPNFEIFHIFYRIFRFFTTSSREENKPSKPQKSEKTYNGWEIDGEVYKQSRPISLRD